MRGSSAKLLLRRAGIPQSGDKKQIFLLQIASSTKITRALVSPRILGRALLVHKTFISRTVSRSRKQGEEKANRSTRPWQHVWTLESKVDTFGSSQKGNGWGQRPWPCTWPTGLIGGTKVLATRECKCKRLEVSKGNQEENHDQEKLLTWRKLSEEGAEAHIHHIHVFPSRELAPPLYAPRTWLGLCARRITRTGESLLPCRQDLAQLSLSSRSHHSPEARPSILLDQHSLLYR